VTRPTITADELRDYWVSRGLPTADIDFEAIAAAQSGRRDVPGWEAPRVLPTSWREVERGPDGAKYMNANARLICILSCSVELDGRAWLHLSCSHAQRIPTWGELRVCKEQFLGDREAYSVVPPRARYVNIHNNVLHLFALLDEQATALPDFTGGTGSL
jgi:hypothetical protein